MLFFDGNKIYFIYEVKKFKKNFINLIHHYRLETIKNCKFARVRKLILLVITTKIPSDILVTNLAAKYYHMEDSYIPEQL